MASVGRIQYRAVLTANTGSRYRMLAYEPALMNSEFPSVNTEARPEGGFSAFRSVNSDGKSNSGLPVG
jgi:hypothetical protein